MAVKLQFRRDTAANWESNNTILSEGEFGLDTTNQRFKIGNGNDGWNDIEFSLYTDKAEVDFYTTTIAAVDWTGTEAPYSVAKTVSGILDSDRPIVDLDLSAVAIGDVEAKQTDFGLIYRVAATATNEITFFATDEPTEELVIQIKVVR